MYLHTYSWIYALLENGTKEVRYLPPLKQTHIVAQAMTAKQHLG